MEQKEEVQSSPKGETFSHDQKRAFDMLCKFVKEDDKSSHGRVFILRGYAGTGKTWLVRRFVEWLVKGKWKYFLLASTGRAAKILSNATGQESRTVHSHIYTFKGFNKDISQVLDANGEVKVEEDGQLALCFEMVKPGFWRGHRCKDDIYSR